MEAQLREGTLVEVLPDWARPPHPMRLVYPASRHLQAKVRVFSAWVAGVFSTIDAGQ